MSLPAIVDFNVVKQAPFKRLRMKHRRVIALHVSGYSNAEVARMLDVSQGAVAYILSNETVRPVLTAIYEQFDSELKSLYPLAIDSMRLAMREGEHKDALKAADLYFKTQGTYDRKEEAGHTAESVIEMILKEAGGAVRKIKYTERKFLKENVQGSDAIEVVDVTPT